MLVGPQGTLRWVQSGVQTPVRPLDVVHGLPTNDLFQSFLSLVPAVETWTELGHINIAIASKALIVIFTRTELYRTGRDIFVSDLADALRPLHGTPNPARYSRT